MLKATTMMLQVEHMKKLKTLAAANGLNLSALTRLIIAEYLRRAARAAGAGKARAQETEGNDYQF